MTSFSGKLTTGDGRLVVQISGQIKENTGGAVRGWSGSFQLPHLLIGKMADSTSLLLDVAGGPRVGIVMEPIDAPRGAFYPRVGFQSAGPTLRETAGPDIAAK